MTRDVGVPNNPISDNSGEQMVPQTELQECICCCFIDGKTMEPQYYWRNRLKETIKIIKYKTKRRIIQRRVSKHLWYFGLVWETEIYARTTGKDGQTPMEILTTNTIDIS